MAKKVPGKKPTPKKSPPKKTPPKKPAKAPVKTLAKNPPKISAPKPAATPAKKDGKMFCVTAPITDIYADPSNEPVITGQDSQILYGETFIVEDSKKDWRFGACATDGYRGWVRESALKPERDKPTHIIDRPLALIYPKPDFKTRPTTQLPYMARVTVEQGTPKNDFVKLHGLGWIHRTHVAKIDGLKQNMDPLAAALKFLGAPYLYGGRSVQGIDCSGLVQLSLSHSDIPCPRDSADQIAIGRGIPIEMITRGDLVFFKGHVGFMIDRTYVLNATARTMDVRIERLEDLAAIYHGIVAVRRLRG